MHLPAPIFPISSLLLTLITAQTQPSQFSNYLVRASTPQNSTTLAIKTPFLFTHLLFFYITPSTSLPQSSIASLCLDLCVSYMPNATAIPLSDLPTPFPDTYTSNRTGPCRSFTVDQGKPYPPSPEDERPRWYCEGFDQELAGDLSDYEVVDAEGSYLYGVGVNRGCAEGRGCYRAF